MKNFGKALENVGGKLQNAGKKLAPLSGAATAGLTAIVGLGVKAGQTADDLNTLSKVTGMSTASIQKLKYASELVDVSFETVQGSMAKLTKNMGAAQGGSKAMQEAFGKLRVSVTDTNGNLRDSEAVFHDAIDALGGIENQAERDALAMELFGKSAQELNPLILGGADALKKLGKEAEDRGLIISQEELDAANALNDEIDKLKADFGQSLMKLGVKISRVLLPAFKKISEKVSEFVDWLNKMDEGTLKTIMKVLALVAGLAPLLIIVGKVTSGLGLLIKGFTLFSGPVGIAVAVIASLIAIGALLIENWDSVEVQASGFAGAIKKVFGWFKDNLPAIKEIAIEVFEKLKDGFKTAFTVMQDVWESVGKPVFDGFMSILGVLWDKWNEHLPAIQEAWETFAGNMSIAYNNTIKPILDAFGEAAEGALKFFGEALGVIIDYIMDFEEKGNIFLPVLLGIIGAFATWKTMLMIQGLISGITAAIGFLTGVTGGLTVAQWLLNAAMAVNPLMWIPLLIGLVIAAGVLLWKNWDTIKEKVVGLWSSMSETFKKIGEAIKGPFQSATTFIKEQVEKIKGFFSGLTLKLPKIKMPHFKLTGSFSLAPPSIPKVGVEWRAKGGYAPRATLFGQSGDKVQGMGEAGGEGIVPLEGKHMFPLADAVANRLSREDRGIVNNFTINATVREEADIRKITKAITDETKRVERARGRVFA